MKKPIVLCTTMLVGLFLIGQVNAQRRPGSGDPERDTPNVEELAEHCKNRVNRVAEACINHIRTAAERHRAEIASLEGKEARRATRVCRRRIVHMGHRCVRVLHRICRRCVHALEVHDASQAAAAVRRLCEDRAQAVANAARRAIHSLRPPRHGENGENGDS